MFSPPAPVWVVIHRHVYHGCRQIPDTGMACVDPHLLPQWCGLMYITSTGTRRYHIEAHWQVAHLLLSALPRLIIPNLNALQYGTTEHSLRKTDFVVNHMTGSIPCPGVLQSALSPQSSCILSAR
jgi:hypothetical protein